MVSGWAKHAIKNSARVGDNVMLNGKKWMIWTTSWNKTDIESSKTRHEESQKKRLSDPQTIKMREKYPNTSIEYVFKTQKVTRQRNYKPYVVYRLLRRVK